jgi:hypothetical protein
MMSKRLKSVMKKLFRGKSRAGMTNTLFQGCSTGSSWQAEMMKHMGPIEAHKTSILCTNMSSKCMK